MTRRAGAHGLPPGHRVAGSAQPGHAPDGERDDDAGDAHVQGEDPPVRPLRDPRVGSPGQVWPTRRAAIMPQPAAQQLMSSPSIATTGPPSPNSKARGNANMSEPSAASITMGASCQILRRRWGRSSTSTSPPSDTAPTEPSSGPSGLRPEAPSTAEPNAGGTPCVSRAPSFALLRGQLRLRRFRGRRSVDPGRPGCAAPRRDPCSLRGPASIATRPPDSDSTGGSTIDDGTGGEAALTGGASRCHHVIRL